METILRKQESILVSAGGGCIVFAVWNVIKALMISLSDKNNPSGLFYVESTGAGGMIAQAATTIMITLVVLALQIYVGRKAIKEGKGQRKGSFYLVVAIFFVLTQITIYSLVIFAISSGAVPDPASIVKPSAIGAYIVELTSFYILILLIVSAFRVRRLRRKLNR